MSTIPKDKDIPPEHRNVVIAIKNPRPDGNVQESSITCLMHEIYGKSQMVNSVQGGKALFLQTHIP